MRPYIKLLIVLSVTFAVMIALSELKDVRILGYEIATMQNDGAKGIDTITHSDTPIKNTVDTVCLAEEDTVPCTILLLGDSMVEGLRLRLGAYAYHNGHKLYTVIWYGSTTKKWAESGKIRHYIYDMKPDYVMICLGGNELFVRDINSHRKYVRKIVSEIGQIPFVWIGPPNWKDDTGINALIYSEIGNRFFVSKDMQFERADDGRHPTKESSYEWMDSVVRWMKHSVPHPRLNTPQMKIKNPYKTIVLTPDD